MHTRPTHLDALVPQLDPDDVALAGPHRERARGLRDVRAADAAAVRVEEHAQRVPDGALVVQAREQREPRHELARRALRLCGRERERERPSLVVLVINYEY